MKFIIKILLIGLLTFFGLKYLPWWVVSVIPFTINLVVKTKGSQSFFSSFFAVSIVWFVMSFLLYNQGAEEFTGKLAGIFFLPQNGLLFLIIISVLMGLIAALSGYSGNALRNIFIKPKSKNKSKYGRPDYSRYSR